MQTSGQDPVTSDSEYDTTPIMDVARLLKYTIVGGCLLALAFAAPLYFGLKVELNAPSGSTQPLPARLSALQLLESEQLHRTVEDVALQLASVAQRLEWSEKTSSLRLGARGQNQRQLAMSTAHRLRKEAARAFRATVQQFLHNNPQAQDALGGLSMTAAQGATTISVLRSFTDERFLDLSMKISEAILPGNASHRHVHGRTANLLKEAVHRYGPEMRALREKFIPKDLQQVSDETKEHHIKLLSKKGAFRLQGEAGGWHSSLQISHNRILQDKPVVQRLVSEVSTSKPMVATTSLWDVSQIANDPSPPIGAVPGFKPPPGLRPIPGFKGFKGVTPLNWFTIGAPAASSLFGLILLTLAALLPGRGGFPRNNPAQYAMWGVQGAATLGECFANFGIFKGAVYIAPCLIDIMFFAFDVAWVFFEGLPYNFPKKNIECAAYSQWPSIENWVCGSCVALVPTENFGGICNRYCESFGHTCVWAAEEVDDDCAALSRYGCDEAIQTTRDMLCQCRGSLPTAPSCAAYSSWPAIREAVCGDCTALALVQDFGGTCSEYCESFGHTCVRAAADYDDDCIRDEPEECDERTSSSDTLCTCELNGAAVPAPDCAPYTDWPKILEFTCGSCEAIVPSFAVVNGQSFKSCSQYCRLFDHVCERAIDENSCGDFRRRDVIDCDEPPTLRLQRCRCVLPGRFIGERSELPDIATELSPQVYSKG